MGELHTVLSYNEHIECQQLYLVFYISNCSFSVLKKYIVTSYSYVEKSAIIFTLSHCGEEQFYFNVFVLYMIFHASSTKCKLSY